MLDHMLAVLGNGKADLLRRRRCNGRAHVGAVAQGRGCGALIQCRGSNHVVVAWYGGRSLRRAGLRTGVGIRAALRGGNRITELSSQGA